MTTLSSSVRFFLHLSKIQSVMTRRFDAGLGGLSFSDFMILHHLSEARGEKMRRVDLADKLGLTASGITRLLAPMEKIGLIKREANERDARVSYVVLAPGGKRKLSEAMEDAEMIADAMIPSGAKKKLEPAQELLVEMAHRTA